MTNPRCVTRVRHLCIKLAQRVAGENSFFIHGWYEILYRSMTALHGFTRGRTVEGAQCSTSWGPLDHQGTAGDIIVVL